jgi:uncharacterized protein YndB with AHSA1/START domain
MMKKVLVTIGAVLIGLVIVAFAVGALLPADWSVERSITIAAPPQKIYPLIANFKTGWQQWNPWQEPTMKIHYAGPDEGVGATQRWEGGDTNGGDIRIVKAVPFDGIEFALRFGSFPIDGKIALKPEGGMTRVTWTDRGRISGPVIYRFMRFMLERFVGQPMDRGLAKLKQQAEA